MRAVVRVAEASTAQLRCRMTCCTQAADKQRHLRAGNPPCSSSLVVFLLQPCDRRAHLLHLLGDGRVVCQCLRSAVLGCLQLHSLVLMDLHTRRLWTVLEWSGCKDILWLLCEGVST
jgi:hypothetical protein